MKKFDTQAALKAGYTQDQINQYLGQYPSGPPQQAGPSAAQAPAGMQQTAPPLPTDQPQGDLETSIGNAVLSMVSGLTKPLRYAGNLLLQDPAMLAQSKLMPMSVDPNASPTQQKLAAGASDFLSKYLNLVKPLGLSEEEAQQAHDNPLGEIARNTANTMSWAVPFGKTAEGANILQRVLTGATLPGAAVGALQTVANTPTDQSLTSPKSVGADVTGAVKGGVASTLLAPILGMPGATSATGELTQKVGSEIRQGVRGIEAKPSIWGASSEQAINKTLDTLGFKGSPANQYAQLEPKFNQLSDQITNVLNNNPKPVSIPGLVKDFMANLQDSGIIRRGELTAKQGQKEISGYIQDLYSKGDPSMPLPETIASPDLFALKQAANTDAKSIFNKLDNGTSLTNREKIILTFRNTLDDKIAELHPEVKQATMMQSHLFDAAQGLAKSRNANISLPEILGTKIPLPSRGVQSIQDFIGRYLQGSGRKMSSVGNAVSPLTQILGQGGSRLAATAQLPEQGQNQTTEVNSGPQYGQGNAQTQYGQNQGNQSNAIIPQTGNQTGMTITPQMVQQAYLQLPPAQAERVANAYKYQFGNIPPEEVQAQLGIVKQGETIAQQVDQLGNKLLQPNVILSNVLGTTLQKGDPQIKQLEAQIVAFNQNVATTLHRRGMSDQMIKSMEPAFIKPGKDSPQDMKNKITGLLYMIQTMYPTTSGNMQGSGQ
jgi:hypothetical protein